MIWIRFLAGADIFYSPPRPDRLWGPLIVSLLSNGYGVSFPGDEGPKSEVDHASQSSAEINSARN
jgi:hypothetical protein